MTRTAHKGSRRGADAAPSTRPMPKTARPETSNQARSWESTKRRYLDAGLCHRCAAQAAYGHQLGWSALEHRPCPPCAPIVERMPRAQVNGWRSTPRSSGVNA